MKLVKRSSHLRWFPRIGIVEKFVWFVARDTLARGYFRHLFWAAVAFVAFPLKMFLQDFRQYYHVSINTKSVSLVVVISPCVLNVWMIVWCYLAFAFWNKLTRCFFVFFNFDFIGRFYFRCPNSMYSKSVSCLPNRPKIPHASMVSLWNFPLF